MKISEIWRGWTFPVHGLFLQSISGHINVIFMIGSAKTTIEIWLSGGNIFPLINVLVVDHNLWRSLATILQCFSGNVVLVKPWPWEMTSIQGHFSSHHNVWQNWVNEYGKSTNIGRISRIDYLKPHLWRMEIFVIYTSCLSSCCNEGWNQRVLHNLAV